MAAVAAASQAIAFAWQRNLGLTAVHKEGAHSGSSLWKPQLPRRSYPQPALGNRRCHRPRKHMPSPVRRTERMPPPLSRYVTTYPRPIYHIRLALRLRFTSLLGLFRLSACYIDSTTCSGARARANHTPGALLEFASLLLCSGGVIGSTLEGRP